MAADRGTRFTNYSSIHSKDAFIGDYQVMYTPGSSPPIQRRKTGSRFASNTRPRDTTQSIIIPSGVPDTSAILPSRGTLRDVHVHYTIPADEKEIVASLRKVQKDLDTAMERIVTLEQERDLAREELRNLRLSMRKTKSAAAAAAAGGGAGAAPTPNTNNNNSKRQDQAQTQASRVEEELFDISRVGDQSLLPSPQKTPKNIGTKRVSLGNNKAAAKPVEEEDDDDAVCLVSPARADKKDKPRRSSMRPTAVAVDEESIVAADPTAASNTSRRRFRADLDENMTSAYIIPDITMSISQQQPTQQQKSVKPSVSKHQLSKSAQAVLHDHGPQHIADCRVCQRLTSKLQPKQRVKSHDFQLTRANDDEEVDAAAYDDDDNNEEIINHDNFTAQITHMINDLNLAEETVRPRIEPAHALAHLKKMLNMAYDKAKQEHRKAWQEYDAIQPPKQSKRHMAAAERMDIWAKKMEEARLNLDQLRDVEEGLKA